MYFNAQRARIPGLRTTSHGWVSTYPLSQNAGRVTTAGSQLIRCLKMRGGSELQSVTMQLVSMEGVTPLDCAKTVSKFQVAAPKRVLL
jgi:hypothetical protein